MAEPRCLGLPPSGEQSGRNTLGGDDSGELLRHAPELKQLLNHLPAEAPICEVGSIVGQVHVSLVGQLIVDP